MLRDHPESGRRGSHWGLKALNATSTLSAVALPELPREHTQKSLAKPPALGFQMNSEPGPRPEWIWVWLSEWRLDQTWKLRGARFSQSDPAAQAVPVFYLCLKRSHPSCLCPFACLIQGTAKSTSPNPRWTRLGEIFMKLATECPGIFSPSMLLLNGTQRCSRTISSSCTSFALSMCEGWSWSAASRGPHPLRA